MSFAEIAAGLTALLAMTGIAAWTLQRSAPFDLQQQLSPAVYGSTLVVVSIAVLMATRSPAFGTDTVAYLQIFGTWCYNENIDALRFSYYFSVFALHAGMLGACDLSLLPFTWIFLIILILMNANESIQFKIKFSSLILLSAIGIELSTNILRQSFSVCLAVVSISYLHRNKGVSLIFAVLSVMAHESAALYMTAGLFAYTRWRWFLFGVLAAVSVVILAVYLGASIFFLDMFIYEIEKYLAHQSDEIFVRAIAVVSIAVALVSPILAASGGEPRSAALRSIYYQAAIKMTVSGLPFVILPYFGYRYLYGVYPLILWNVMKSVNPEYGYRERTFWWIAAANASILIAWASGSSYIRSIPFYE